MASSSGFANPYLEIELFVTTVFIVFQLGMATWATNNAITPSKYTKKRSIYRFMLALSMIFHLLAFLPLLRTTGLTASHLTNPKDISTREDEIGKLQWIHNVFFAASSLNYCLVIQMRLSALRVISPYPKLWDRIGIAFTVAVWTVLCLYHVVMKPMFTESSGIFFGAVWSGYVLLVDNLVSIIFVTILHQFQARNKKRETKEKQKLRWTLITCLVMNAILTWIFLAFPITCATLYANDPVKRRLAYRFGYCFSTFIYFGAMIFIYAVCALFGDGETSINSNSSEEYPTLSENVFHSDCYALRPNK
jgi:heme/copper-type cytochrome/quinol oxidase subunit 2